jgi:molecular chaperone HtpG
MYVNALAIYREYVQNAADAIDEAAVSGIIDAGAQGIIQVTVDHQQRLVRIRDNGTGVPAKDFVKRLVAFGASKKRGLKARGFRGVGRLAGLGYCQELIFRSRAAGETEVSEMRWDCRRLKSLLRNAEFSEKLDELVGEVVATRQLKNTDFPDHFFEVELAGIVRHGNDVLMHSAVVESYLSQVAPVPFSPEFTYGKEIERMLRPYVNLGNVQIFINGGDRPVYRPHQNEFTVRKNTVDKFGELQFLTIPASDGPIAGVGWLLHHGYLGALPNGSIVKGLRLRSGNMQIGEADLLDEVFPEPRFNSWVVGEVHVLDERIFPNGRRDHFEHNVHFANIINQLSPLARELGRKCRTSSVRRNCIRQFDQITTSVRERASILRQGAIGRAQRARLSIEIQELLAKLEKIPVLPLLDIVSQRRCSKRLKHLKGEVSKLTKSQSRHQRLHRMRGLQKRLVERVVDLIYEAFPNKVAAKQLVDRILRGL